MRITNLSLENFGQHAQVNYNFDGAIVGIVGKNGSGKSTILKAIRYALTGEVSGTEKVSSFILATGTPENAPKFGSVQMGIRKHGVDGNILRKIKKSTTERTLLWDGKAHTKAADVDTILSDMLGASRRVINSTVFIPQGDLDKILFGLPSERETLLMRLLLLEHLEGAAKVLDKQIAILSEDLFDHSVALDEIMGQRRGIESQIVEVNAKIAASRDWTGAIALMNEYNGLQRRWKDTLPAEIADNQRATALASDAMANATRLDTSNFQGEQVQVLMQHPQLAQPASIAGLEAALDAVRASIATITARINWIEQKLATQRQLARGEDDLAQAAEQENIYAARIQPISAEDTTEAAVLQTALDAVRALDFRRPELEGSQKRIAEITVQLAELRERWKSESHAWKERESAVEAEFQTIGQLSSDLNAKLRLQTTLQQHRGELGKQNASELACPLCHQAVTPGMLMNDDGIAQLQQQISDLFTRSGELRKDKTDTENRIWQLSESGKQKALELENASNDAAQKQKLIEAFEADVPANFDRQAAGIRINEIQQKDRERSDNLANHARWVTRKTQLAGQVQTDKAKLEALLSKVSDATDLLATDVSVLAAKKSVMESIVTVVTPKLDSLRTASANLDQAQREGARLQREYDTLSPKVEELRMAIVSDAQLNEVILWCDRQEPSVNVVTALNDRQAAHNQLQGEKRSLDSQSSSLVTRQRDIEKKIEANEIRHQLVADLRSLSKLFSRDGLPMLYMKKKFAQLASLTQSTLAELGSPFIVEPDPENDLCFRFLRVDKEDSPWLEQDKLSGGQRVRLTFAFLLATQKLVLPEVGLLVLDEPLDGLDDESISAMVGFLSDIESKMADAEFQIIIVTHRKEFVLEGLRKVINLG